MKKTLGGPRDIEVFQIRDRCASSSYDGSSESWMWIRECRGLNRAGGAEEWKLRGAASLRPGKYLYDLIYRFDIRCNSPEKTKNECCYGLPRFALPVWYRKRCLMPVGLALIFRQLESGSSEAAEKICGDVSIDVTSRDCVQWKPDGQQGHQFSAECRVVRKG